MGVADADFDYVIVGGGSAGAVLAARLSEDPTVSVCLLEAGGAGRGLLVRAPAAAVAAIRGRPRLNNWAYETVPQARLDGRRGYQPRGRVLGGSSAINAMLYTRGHPRDYDEWAALGATGWAWDDVLPYFRRAERNQRGADAFHGADGPLQVADQASPRPVARAFVAAAAECQIRRNDDFNGAEQEGAGLYQVTQFFDRGRRGERCSAAAAYLHDHMDRPNLTVLTRAVATRILFDGRRACGVRYRRRRREHAVSARREVILSAGAFNSPQLLMLSGVGPAAELARHGIAVVHDLPEVGAGLQDHLDFVVAWTSPTTDLFGLGLAGTRHLLRQIAAWRRDGSGMIATPFAEAGAFVKSDPGLERPDLQLHFVIAMVEDHARTLRRGYGYSCHVCVLRPHGRGTVRLASADPLAPPAIDPGYLGDARDAASLLRGVRLMRRILAAPALAPFRGREVHLEGVAEDDEAALTRHIRARADTIYHPVGTCRMGSDADAVVDPALCVAGLEGLRVVDASVMPRLIGGNTNAPTIMIAERATDLIRGAA
ncbi:GMC family oxidoreductase N-terminal domain-containing protein [Aquibium sp. A9E412]|uniref:GMC family oxidoreductase n=1 Tax=Aquibium sp. A9E412 TaxID=2976767 RepID=UPI0025B1D093|nr:GMC family oxidoreductase N-terminal domain-containing protein [Aquibium sp. A9E412]MDN2567078.1 GMC family oxidoreductase N-terminal domain-containing protein [Aquibium sp. A9E412]